MIKRILYILKLYIYIERGSERERGEPVVVKVPHRPHIPHLGIL